MEAGWLFVRQVPYPIDAIRNALKKYKTLGSYRIQNRKLERAMWLFLIDTSNHMLLPEEDAKAVMKTPAWFAALRSES